MCSKKQFESEWLHILRNKDNKTEIKDDQKEESH
jgi:hypothetical protein